MKYSIIMPVYNVENYIEQCINSIIKQTYHNYELLIIDDGSTDNSINIAKKMTKNLNNVKILTKKNGGLSDARNFGLDYATGDFVWFVDSDDYIRNDALEILAKQPENDIICFGYYKVNENIKKEVNIGNSDYDNIRRYLLYTPSACTKIYKRKFLRENKIKFEKGKYYEDLGLTPWLIKYTNKIGFVDQPLYFYIIRNNSIMTSPIFNEKKDDRFWAIDNIINNICCEYYLEIEYIAIKQLIVMYLIDILKCKKSIYKPRIKRIKEYLNLHFPNYINNIYLKKEKKSTKIFVYCFKSRLIFLCKLMIRLGGY